ncbi:MAG: AAA family ATPase [Sphaerochaetaceae bacterium]|nr:AAA family ATPase [Sphaerochaetaceae bacterium]
MYIVREIDSALADWKNSKEAKPLLVRGVRQCGKTSSIRNLGKEYRVFIEINFERDPSFSELFEPDFNVDRICSEIELKTGKEIRDDLTLLFFDEIQNCPKAITALRYFWETKPALHVIAAGSLLEFALNNKKNKISFPVGRVRSIYMHPLSFNEFLSALGKDLLAAKLKKNNEIISDAVHAEYISLYKSFLVVGGMPEAVLEYANSGSYLRCQRIHRDIVDNFESDFGKYSDSIDPEEINEVFQFVFRNVGNQIVLSKAIPGMKAARFKNVLDLLSMAGLIHQVKSSTCEGLPLGCGNKNISIKVLCFDTGVYLTKQGYDATEILRAVNLDSMNKGSIVEMQTGLELVKNADKYQSSELYYWKRTGANAEVDYVIQKKDKIIPIEVKANTTGKMQSMAEYLKTHDTPYGIRVSLENFAISMYQKKQICVVPVYGVNTIRMS